MKIFHLFYLLVILSALIINNNYAIEKKFIKKTLGEEKTKYINLHISYAPTSKNSFSLYFTFTIKPPYHINSNKPLIEGLIPTKLILSLAKNNPQTNFTININPIQYPPNKLLKIDKFETTVYFEGQHTIPVNVKINGEKIVSDLIFDYQFDYQACEEEVCFAPESIKSSLVIDKKTISQLSTYNKTTSPLSPNLNWFLFFIFSFLGGFLLNFMPCVFPIMSLKLFSLNSMKQYELGLKKKFVAYYIAGATTFFLVLGMGLSILKYTGQSIGWGIQFQSPYYLIFIIMVLWVVSLNLLGLFEIFFSYSPLVTKHHQSQSVKNFSLGFFTVILATPCTAPFLGVAISYAFSQSIPSIILFHIYLAIGFLLPYWLIFFGIDISLWLPNLKKSQKYFKQILGFLIILTIIWLLDIYLTVVDFNNIILLFFSLWLIAFLIWIYGKIQIKLLNKKITLFIGIVFLLIITTMIIYLPQKPQLSLTNNSYYNNKDKDKDKENNKDWKNKNFNSSKINWIDFNKTEIDRLLMEGRIVYVHFTADWCLNCKVNEKIVIERKEIIDLFKKYNILTMKADWTKSNTQIFNEIRRLKRGGIPLDVIYFPNGGEVILNSILTIGNFKDALNR